MGRRQDRSGNNVTGLSLAFTEGFADNDSLSGAMQAAAAPRGVKLSSFHARDASEFERAFAGMTHAGMHGLIVLTDPMD